jgi:acyl carrier protein
MFVLNRPHRLERQRSGGAAAELLLERVPFDLQVSQFDLSLQIDQVDDTFTAVWEYDVALFDESTVAQWAAWFERLLGAAAADADRPLSELGLREPGGQRTAPATGTPGSPGARDGRPFVEPRTAAEEAIAAIFGEVLGLDRVSACDSLFDLGADSAHAAQVVSRLAALAGRKLDARLVFDAPTAEQLGAHLESLLLEQAQYAPDPD